MTYSPSIILFFIVLFCLPLSAQLSQDSSRYYYTKIVSPQNAQDLIDGFTYYTQQKEEALAIKDTSQTIYALQLIGLAELSLGASYDAEATYIEALKWIDVSAMDPETLRLYRRSIYTNLGNAYQQLAKYGQATTRYQQALMMVETPQDSAYLYNDISVILQKQDQIPAAIAQAKRAYDLINKTSDTVARLVMLDNWGFLESKQASNSGRAKMEKALALRKAIQDRAHLYISYKHLSGYHADNNTPQLAQAYADSGYAAAQMYSPIHTEDALETALALRPDPRIREFLHLNDSLEQARLRNENKYATAKYNLQKEKAQTEAARLETEAQKQRTQNYLMALISAILLFLLIGYWIIANRNKRQLEAVYATEHRISKKVHDEIANDLYQVMTQLQLQPEATLPMVDALETVYSKTRDLSREHSSIDVGTDFGPLLDDLLLSYNGNGLQVLTRNSKGIDWETVATLKKKTLYRVVQELMTNAKKHSQASLVVIQFIQNGPKVRLTYTDNGIGSDLLKKNGLQNVETRMAAIKGTITFKTEPQKGFHAVIHL